MATKKKPDAKRGRPPVPIEQDPQRCPQRVGEGGHPMTRRGLITLLGGVAPIAMACYTLSIS
jgi:hypothetical protein